MNDEASKRRRKIVQKAIMDQDTEFLDVAFASTAGNMLRCADKNGYTLLHFAAENSTKKMIKYLMKKGFSVKRRRCSQTALHLAVIGGNYLVVKYLLNTAFCVDEVDDLGRTPLHYAVSSFCQRESPAQNRIIRLLIRRGANVRASSDHGETPFLQAMEHGSEYLTRLFLEQTGLVHRRNKNGETPLHLAVQNCNRDIVEILLDAGACVGSTTATGKTALHLAAAAGKCADIVNLLIERGAIVDAVDNNGETPIFAATYFPPTDINSPVNLKHRHDIISSLLEAGAKVDHCSDAGEPTFHKALKTGFTSVIEMFLKRDVDVKCKNASGWTSLHVAVKYVPDDKIVDTLIDKGVPINARTSKEDMTPLHFAVQCREETHVKSLIARGADVNVRDYMGQTALYYAVLYDYPDMNILLENGADILIESSANETPFDCAMKTCSITTTIECLLRHLVLIEAMGDPMASKVIIRGIGNDSKWLQTYEMYRREISSMKEQRMCEKMSYFEILSHHSLWNATFLREAEFRKAFKDDEVVQKFPLFGEMTKKRFHDAVYRRGLIEIVIKNLFLLFNKFKIPISIVEKIVMLYKFEDLEKFANSCQQPNQIVGNFNCTWSTVQGSIFTWMLEEQKRLLHCYTNEYFM